MKQGIFVELEKVGKSFQGRKLFAGIDAYVRPGECLAVTGCNGSGKSTLLKIIAGVVRPSCGTVRFKSCHQEISRYEYWERVGVVSPDIVMYNTLTGYENIEFLLKTRGSGNNHAVAQECLETVGLKRYGGDLVRTYSTGMRQRLKLAALVALNTEIWLLDEPSSNLDEDGRQIVEKIIRFGLERNNTVILATNESAEAGYADKIINMA